MNNLVRCKNAIDQELSNLEVICYDWSSWSDTYAYVQQPDKTYEDSNLVDETFTSFQIQLIFILNNRNKVVWGKIFNPDFESEIELKGFAKNHFQENHPLLQFDHTDDLKEMSKTGIWVSKNGPLFIVSNPILKSNSEGPVNGTLIMGKFLTKTVVERIKSQVGSGFKIISPDESGRFHSIEAKISNNDGVYIETGEKTLKVYSAYWDIKSKIAFIIEAPFPREISKNGIATLNFSSTVMIITTLIILLILHFLLRKSIIKPIAVLKDFTSEIKLNKDYYQRVSIESLDEIGTLAYEMNDMVGTIADQTTLLTKTNLKLKKSLDEIKTLKGIIPICAKCKKIRDDEGYWNILESFIEEYSEASFSHSICPECAQELYGGNKWFSDLKKIDAKKD
ncbi:MAG: hypothetical protein GY702_27820 [Desulfobulbaceae bacterium]|nr:hypothetical protein [Desulfobulbaceae bacterium]